MDATELKERMAALAPVDGPAPAHTWPRHRLSIRNHTATDDPAKFLGWSTIVATFFVGSGAEFTPLELTELPGRYLDILPEPLFGDPETMQVDGVTTSGNIIHQTYHLAQFEQHGGVKVSELASIVEFGGGYGLMALLCRRLGFVGRYTIIDLPELSLLQEYYLSNTIGLWNIELINNYNFERLDPDLLFGIYSLSEIPVSMRYQILHSIQAPFIFMVHQDQHTMPDGETVNNIDSFAEIAATFKLDHWPNPLMPGHYYVCSKNLSS